MEKNMFSKEGKIGLSTIIALLLLFFGFNFLKGINMLKPSNYYYAKINNVTGLAVSTPVLVHGYNIGLIRDIDFNSENPSELILQLNLNQDFKLPAGTKAYVFTELMGTAYVNLEIDDMQKTYLNPGDTILAIRESSITEKATNDLMPKIEVTMARIDSVLISLQRVLESPTITRTLESVEQTSKQLELASTQLNLIMRKDLPQTLGHINTISANLETTTDNLKQIDFNKTVKNVDDLLLSIRTATDKLNRNDNSLGLLLNDDQLYRNLSLTTEKAGSLLIDLQEHPKRYVHFSIFGRKDK
ncbi:MAG: MlaD family protein [Bacteroidales bacterium]|jgi:phospholipid/cholesterol/gamma-HCH transport system substrate-binding protein|nr:MlaD family protein [Bacteroidales bacterium]MDD3161634.1 MlaD family protein [Bacteroidales bacterium]